MFLMYIVVVCRRFEPPFYTQAPYMAIPYVSLFPISPLLAPFFRQYCPKEMHDKHKIRPVTETCFFMFRRLQNNTMLFISKTYIYITRLRFDLK